MIKEFRDSFKGVNLPINGVRLPAFNLEQKYLDKVECKEGVSNFSFLQKLCLQGLKQKGLEKDEKYLDRLKYELKTLHELSFTDYILLVWDVINFCKDSDIPVGLGRGSAAGSLTLYCIGVTGIDPVKYDLFFERFVSKTRAKKQVIDGVTYLDGSLMVDVDLDICYYNRPKVLEYINTKFEGNTSKILTLNTLSGKLLMKECGKIVDEKEESEMNHVTSLIPKIFGQVKDIDEAYKEVEEFADWCKKNPRTFNVAKKLKGLNKNRGVHASGMLVSYDKLVNQCPTELDSCKAVVSSYDMNWVSLINVKLDLLGLRSVSVVNEACKQIGITPADIDFNDPEIYQNLQELRTPHGLFQIEADTNYKVCKTVKPRNIEQLSAVLALARPGALDYVDKYASYVNTGTYESIHPFFDDILEYTGGVCLYQEQMMKMAHKIGFTLDEAEILRRIVGKKKVDQVAEWKQKIVDKVKENNLEPEIGNVLWKVLEDSANYSFNKSHSLGYAALAASTIYLKFKHPKEFFLALLKMTRHEPDPIDEINKINRELGFFGIELLKPHIVKSDLDFKIEEGNIRFGLLSIKGVSDKSMQKINDFKSEKNNKFEVFEAARQCGINIGVLSSLIQAGALDGYDVSRSYLCYEAQLWNIFTDREKALMMHIGDEFDYHVVKTYKKLQVLKNEKGKTQLRESRIHTIKTKAEGYKEIFEQNRKNEDFANWYYETMLLGYCYGKRLKDIFLHKNRNLLNIRELQDMPNKSTVFLVARVKEGKVRTSKNNNKYLWLDVSDETGDQVVMVFNSKRGNKMDDCIEMNGGVPKKESICVIKGEKQKDTIFAQLVAVQSNKIYTKLSELKNSV